MKKPILLVVLSLIVTTLSFGQNASLSKRTPSGKIRCSSTQYENYLRAEDPNRETREQFETWLAPK